MQSEESNTLIKLAKAVIEHAPEGGDAFWDIKFSDIEAALSAAEPVCCGKPVHEGSPEAYTLECCGKFVQSAPSVAVKDLEWSPRNDQPQYEVCADTPFGRYKTSNKGEYGFGWMQPRQTAWSGFLPTLEEAKAAAQADYDARIRSALSAQVQDVAGWQPIETAPKDGTPVILWTVWVGDEISPDPFSDVQIGYWDHGNDLPESHDFSRRPEWVVQRIGEPTHWMPLPAAPAKQEGSESNPVHKPAVDSGESGDE